MFSAARLVTARCRASEPRVAACGCSSVVRSTAPRAAPRRRRCCRRAASTPWSIALAAPATRARPPGSTRQRRALAHREHAQHQPAAMCEPRRRSQVGICDSGRQLLHACARRRGASMRPAHSPSARRPEIGRRARLEARLAALERVRRLDRRSSAELRQHRFHAGALRRTTRWASAGSCSFSPSRRLASAGRKPQQRRRFEQAGAERVGHQHVAGAQRLQQARARRARSRGAARAGRSSRRPAGAGSRAPAAGPAASSGTGAASRTVRSLPSTSVKPR